MCRTGCSTSQECTACNAKEAPTTSNSHRTRWQGQRSLARPAAGTWNLRDYQQFVVRNTHAAVAADSCAMQTSRQGSPSAVVPARSTSFTRDSTAQLSPIEYDSNAFSMTLTWDCSKRVSEHGDRCDSPRGLKRQGQRPPGVPRDD